MMPTVYCVTDLGPGDGGKGGIVHYLANRFKAYTVVKEGGAQGSHGVVTSRGEKFNFSQWGCGTLEGIPTYLSKRFIVSATGLINEAEALARMGINNPFKLLSLSSECLVSTPYHLAWSRLDELLRKNNPRGTVGTGVGKAYRDAVLHPDNALYAGEIVSLSEAELREKLTCQRKDILAHFEGLTLDAVLPEDEVLFLDCLNILRDESSYVLKDVIGKLSGLKGLLTFRKLEDVLEKGGMIVVERSHGVLTDSELGLKPHVSAIRTLPKFSEEMFKHAGFNGNFKHIGVHRAYEIRHGAGPMPTADATWNDMLPGSHKENNRWQGAVRFGPLDTVLLKYALLASRETKFDCLALSWFDQLFKHGKWEIATEYFDRNGLGVLTHQHDDFEPESLARLPQLIEKVDHCSIDEIQLNIESLSTQPRKCLEFADRILSHYVDVPVRLLSLGPTEQDKYII